MDKDCFYRNSPVPVHFMFSATSIAIIVTFCVLWDLRVLSALRNAQVKSIIVHFKLDRRQNNSQCVTIQI